MIRSGATQWLLRPRPTLIQAVLCAAAAVAVPTLIRAAVNGAVIGCEFTPYLPFVFVAALVLRWWAAALAALASLAVLGGLFVAPLHDPACFASSAAIFLVASAGLIGAVALIRATIAGLQSRGADGPSDGVVFSLEEGEVWASWYGEGPPLRLGSQQRVSAMMADFLKQEEIGKRLSGPR
jgi:hypothetical protein